MKWNDLAFWKKLTIAFGSLLVLIVVSSTLSFTGMKSAIEDSRRTELLNGLHDHFNEKIVEHYQGINKVAVVLMDAKSTRLGAPTDDHKCKLGTWLYGGERGNAEQLVPGLAPLLKKLEAPHARLHASFTEIEKAISSRNGSNNSSVTETAFSIYQSQTLSAVDDVHQVMSQISELLETEAVKATNRQHETSDAAAT